MLNASSVLIDLQHNQGFYRKLLAKGPSFLLCNCIALLFLEFKELKMNFYKKILNIKH